MVWKSHMDFNLISNLNKPNDFQMNHVTILVYFNHTTSFSFFFFLDRFNFIKYFK